MEHDSAMWSRAFVRKIAAHLGFVPESEAADASRAEVETLLRDMTEDFRHLRVAQWKWVEDFTQFLGGVGGSTPHQSLEQLREVRSYVAFLRQAHGREQPADEGDEWT